MDKLFLAPSGVQMTCFIIVLTVLTLSQGEGRIDECLTFCDENPSPVCALCNDELRNFTNACFVRKENNCFQGNCEIANEGFCGPQCGMACTNEYDPKCASNGKYSKTFNNFCRLKSYNKCRNETYQVIANGPCSFGVV